MKTSRLWALAALALACGGRATGEYRDEVVNVHRDGDVVLIEVYDESADDGDDDETGDIGELEQGLTIPNGYGTKTSVSQRCWDGVDCLHPGTKEYSYNFQASTCSSWYQGRFVAADIRFGTQVPWFTKKSGGTKNTWRCASGNGSAQGCTGSLGCAVVTFNQHEVITDVDVYIFPDVVSAQSGWSSKTQAQKDRFVDNAILHEIYHSVALGHSDATLDSVLMYASAPSAYYSSLLQPQWTERAWLRDYQP
jgi:hypothetical protein